MRVARRRQLRLELRDPRHGAVAGRGGRRLELRHPGLRSFLRELRRRLELRHPRRRLRLHGRQRRLELGCPLRRRLLRQRQRGFELDHPRGRLLLGQPQGSLELRHARRRLLGGRLGCGQPGLGLLARLDRRGHLGVGLLTRELRGTRSLRHLRLEVRASQLRRRLELVHARRGTVGGQLELGDARVRALARLRGVGLELRDALLELPALGLRRRLQLLLARRRRLRGRRRRLLGPAGVARGPRQLLTQLGDACRVLLLGALALGVQRLELLGGMPPDLVELAAGLLTRGEQRLGGLFLRLDRRSLGFLARLVDRTLARLARLRLRQRELLAMRRELLLGRRTRLGELPGGLRPGLGQRAGRLVAALLHRVLQLGDPRVELRLRAGMGRLELRHARVGRLLGLCHRQLQLPGARLRCLLDLHDRELQLPGARHRLRQLALDVRGSGPRLLDLFGQRRQPRRRGGLAALAVRAMGLELLARRRHLAAAPLERLGDLAAGLLACLDRSQLELRRARVGVRARLLGRRFELGRPGLGLLDGETQLGNLRRGLLARQLEGLLHLAPAAMSLFELLLQLAHAAGQRGLGALTQRALGGDLLGGLLARLRDARLRGGDGLGQLARGLRANLLRRLLGLLDAGRGLLPRLLQRGLERGDALLGVPRHGQQRALDLTRTATGALELLTQLGRRRRELALQTLAFLALGLELLGRATADRLQPAGRILARLRQLATARDRRLLGGGDPRLGLLARLCRGALDLPHAPLELLPRGLQRALGVGGAPAQRLQLGGVRSGRSGGLGERALRRGQPPAEILGGPVAVGTRPRETLLERRGDRDLAGPRGGLLVEPVGQRCGLIALAIAFGAQRLGLAQEPMVRLARLTRVVGLRRVQLRGLLLRAGQLAPQLGDLRLGARESLVVLLAHAALRLDAALELREELLAYDVEAVALGEGVAQLLAQLLDAALGRP